MNFRNSPFFAPPPAVSACFDMQRRYFWNLVNQIIALRHCSRAPWGRQKQRAPRFWPRPSCSGVLMRRRELVFAVSCAFAGAALAYAMHLLIGGWPSPVIYYAMIVIGLGAALVTVRYGRLGP